MRQGRALSALIGKAHIFEFYPVIPGRLGIHRHFLDRSLHYLIDTSQSSGGQHHTGSRKHDLRQRSGYNSGKHCIKSKICDKRGKISAVQGFRGQKQSRRD